MALTKEQIVGQLKGKDVAVQFTEVIDLVVQLEASVQLMKEHRELLGNAVRNYIGDRHKAWSAVSEEEQKAEGNDVRQQQFKDKRELLEAAIKSKLSGTVIPWVEKQVSSSADDEHKIYYWTLLGSMNAFLSELGSGDSKVRAIGETEKYFDLAVEKAKAKLSAAHVYRLDLALCYSCFQYDILSAHDRACRLAQDTINDALVVMNDVKTPSAEAISIVQKLRDRLTAWTSDPPEESGLSDES